MTLPRATFLRLLASKEAGLVPTGSSAEEEGERDDTPGALTKDVSKGLKNYFTLVHSKVTSSNQPCATIPA